MDKVPVMVLRNKANNERYLAANADVGDWEDENLDVTLEDIQNAYVIARKDRAAPTSKDFEEHREFHRRLKEVLTEKFGPDPFMSLDFEEACEHYEPVIVHITPEQLEYARGLMEE